MGAPPSVGSLVSAGLGLFQVGLLLATALEAPHAYHAYTVTKRTDLSAPNWVVAAVCVAVFAGQCAFTKMTFDTLHPPMKIQRYMTAGILVQLFLVRAIARRMFATSALLGALNLVVCFERVYVGAGVTGGVRYGPPCGGCAAARLRAGESDPGESALGRGAFFRGVSAAKGLLIAQVNWCILLCLPRKENPGICLAWTVFVVLVCGMAATATAEGGRRDVTLPAVVAALTLGGPLARGFDAVRGAKGPMDLVVPWVQLACCLRVCWSVSLTGMGKVWHSHHHFELPGGGDGGSESGSEEEDSGEDDDGKVKRE